jgi:hypothetical protein
VTFANLLPWWALALMVAAAAVVAWLAYSRWTLPPGQRFGLTALRFITLIALLVFVLRPVSITSIADTRAAVVPILVDTSRSMSIDDTDDGSRIERARRLVVDRIVPAIAGRFAVETLSFGEGLAAVQPPQLAATGRQSDLAAALTAVRDRYRGRPVAGLVIVSDGGDTSGGAERAAAGMPPVFAVGVGAASPRADHEILGVTVAEQVLDGSRVDLAVSAVSHGTGRSPIELRLLENGRVIDVRRAAPAGEGTPVREVFQVSPGAGAPTIYTIETPVASGELVPENNKRSVLVQPPSRPRRVLMVEGAPGYEHSFLKRTWAADRGLELDSVVRKGKDERGGDTFYIQAAKDRAGSLTTGFTATREALFLYDALVLANVDGHQFGREQLEATRAFVSARGGGLLLFGARSFAGQGLSGTTLAEALPLEMNSGSGPGAIDDPGAAVPASNVRDGNRVTLTAAGIGHPIMQLAPAPDESRRRWEALPPLASTTAVGNTRPGASVLAVTSGPGQGPRPLIAVQRFGEGRSMVFAGEASWRWRMMLPAADRTYDTFWQQALRWLAVAAPEPMQLSIAGEPVPGQQVPVTVQVRNAGFEPQPEATVTLRVSGPDGKSESLIAAPASGSEAAGRYVASFRPSTAGVFRISAEASRRGAGLGSATLPVLVGGADAEMSDPRLNLQLLDRLAQSSGGRVLGESEIQSLPDLLQASMPAAALSVRRDLWHTGWSFAAILLLLGAEWLLRRRWGLR